KYGVNGDAVKTNRGPAYPRAWTCRTDRRYGASRDVRPPPRPPRVAVTPGRRQRTEATEGPRMQTTTIALDEETHLRLRRLALEERTSFRELIREAIDLLLARKSRLTGQALSTWTMVYTVDGKQHRESTGEADKEEALKVLRKRQVEIDEGTYTRPERDRLTVRELLDSVVLHYEMR